MELIKYENEIAVLSEDTRKQIVELESQLKLLSEQEDKLKKAILEEMESKGIIKIETDSLAITYVAPTDRETFDKESFRNQYSDLYDEFIKMTPVKSSIRIKVKNE